MQIYARAAVAWYGWGSPIGAAVILVAIATTFYIIVRAALLL